MTSGLAGLQSMNESRQPVREVEVSRVPLIAIWLQSDESLCIWAEGKRGGRGVLHSFFLFFFVRVHVSVHACSRIQSCKAAVHCEFKWLVAGNSVFRQRSNSTATLMLVGWPAQPLKMCGDGIFFFSCRLLCALFVVTFQSATTKTKKNSKASCRD